MKVRPRQVWRDRWARDYVVVVTAISERDQIVVYRSAERLRAAYVLGAGPMASLSIATFIARFEIVATTYSEGGDCQASLRLLPSLSERRHHS